MSIPAMLVFRNPDDKVSGKSITPNPSPTQRPNYHTVLFYLIRRLV